MNFIKKISESIKNYGDHNAFYINETFYTYKDFALEISKIRIVINKIVGDSEKWIGLVTNDDIETYAAIIALWLEGKAYVPINPSTPLDRNIQILHSTETNYIIDTSESSIYKESHNIISPRILENVQIDLEPKRFAGEQLAYILFTSGTTGEAKGVPITFNNVNGLVVAIESDPNFELKTSDRCLQMFELTFDFSLVAYLFPLLNGCCIYTIPKEAIKYFYIYKLIKEHELTVLTMVPSIINYLRPYFSEIEAPHVRYCSFGGGALHSDIAQEWSDCIPNCQILNYYGPTEYTVYSGYYPYLKGVNEKSYNGIISIGKPLQAVEYIVVDDKNKEVPVGITGELCLAGIQLTSGYWKNEEYNKQSFFVINNQGVTTKYYKTGDLCFKDKEGDYMFVGRADFQVKIRGYRVELAEIEYHAKKETINKENIVVLDIINKLGNAELGLVIESKEYDTSKMFDYMKTKMPSYMIPTHVRFIQEFPHSINGKIDRKELRKLFNITNDQTK